jgi:hypothetical protein
VYSHTPYADPRVRLGGSPRAVSASRNRLVSGKRTIAASPLAVVSLPPSRTRGSAYGVWLYTSQRSAQFLGFPDTVVGRDGRLDTVADLSPDTPNYREVLLTLERSRAPTRPGTIVLRGRLVIATQGEAGTPTQTTP